MKLQTDKATRVLYSTDASIYHCEPLGVFFPETESDIAEAVRRAREKRVPLLARGAGTSLSGQAITSGYLIDICSFDHVRIAGGRAIVGPGAVIDSIDRAAAPHGLRFGPTPASSNRATIGGLLANNGTGARSIRFGMAEDCLLSARVMLSDGSIRTFRHGDLSTDPLTSKVLSISEPFRNSTRWPRTWRNASGLNLRGIYNRNSLLPLFCGSEGSLGIILEAEIVLVPRATKSRLAIYFYDDLVSAMRAVPALLETGPSAIELMDENVLRLAKESKRYRMRVITETPPAVLIVEHEDELPTLSGARMILDDPADQADVWNTRKEGLGILMSTRAARRPLPFIEDCAVPVPALPEYVTRLSGILRKHGTEGAYYAHASAGCLHIRPLLDLSSKPDRERMDAIMEETVDLVAELGGTLTGEHGDGRSKTPYHERIFGKELVEAFEKVRDAFDPHRIFRAAGETTLRADRPVRKRPDLVPEIDRCNGEGACRKMSGVMCPSYQATGDESLSTRGRANLLRAWTEGHPVEEALDASLSKCLACKACSFECPSQVDMARLKSEYIAERGPGITDRFFANYESLSKLGRRFGMPLEKLVKRIAGIHPRAPLPRPTPKGFMREFHVPNPDALLFIDTHIEYYEPQIGEAAMKVFERMKLKVLPVRPGCCGRPAYSRGIIDRKPLDFPGTCPIIVVEPSCLSMFTEDRKDSSGRFVSLEEFVIAHADRLGPLSSGAITFHSHCHQKAMGRSAESRAMLALAGNVTEIDSGCCGMAGSFGYEHYDLSLAIAEDRFLPSLRKAKGTMIAASGRSCREMAGRHGIAARHPIEILADSL